MNANPDRFKNSRKIGKYMLTETIGQGQFATVYLGIDTETNKQYAVKCQSKKLSQENERYRKQLNDEIKIMHCINHPNIIHLYELLESSNNYYLIIDYCNQGDFSNYLRNRKLSYLPEKEAIDFLKQIVVGFKELRSHEIMHRDLKLENIMVHDDKIKIADFGMAKIGQSIANTVVGSFITMAPELLTNDIKVSYTAKADLWSMGFIYYQMLFGDYPFYGLTPNEIGQDIRQKSGNLPFKHQISDASKDLLNRLLQMDPNKRIDWPEFFNHQLFVSNFPRSLRDFVRRENADESMPHSTIYVDQEFARNRQEYLYKIQNGKNERSRTPPRRNDHSNYQIDPVSKSQKDRNNSRPEFTQVQDVREEVPNEKELSRLQRIEMCNEVAKRYNHEKNKIAYIVYIVRGIRKLVKTADFSNISPEMSIVAILLLKKAITLNDLNIISLNEEKNIFDQPGFNDLMNSPFLETVFDFFRSDKPNFENYLNYLRDSIDKKNLPNEVRAIVENIASEQFRLATLDEMINDYYDKLVSFRNEVSEEQRHEFILMLVSIFYGVHCEIYFPYRLNNVKFQWNEFYDLHETMSDEALLKIIK